MSEFNGFPEEGFNCCERSEKIRTPINILKSLRAVVEPELRKINPKINGHVSRIKERASNTYRDWAWLYFNTEPKEAYRYSQLTVNISPNRLYVGMDIRTSAEYRNYRKKVLDNENAEIFENAIRILSTRDLFVSTEWDNWETAVARKHSVEELRGDLLVPELFWINIPFEKDDPRLQHKSFAKEVVSIFKDLYNIYAFASGNKPILQTPSKRSFVSPVVVEEIDTIIEPQESKTRKMDDFLNSLKTPSNASSYHLSGKDDQYLVKRKALEYDLTPQEIIIKGVPTIIYSDQDVTAFRDRIFQDYEEFAKLSQRISGLFPLPKNFLKIMYVNVFTDARYSQTSNGNEIFVNLAAFHTQRDLFFWLFTVVRELAYFRTHRIGYPFFKDMRWLTIHALNNLKIT